MSKKQIKNILSVDVEDWFHILDLSSVPDVTEWENLESRVKKNFFTLLDEFDKTDTKVTCFFLGWVAYKFPEIVKEASLRGHEIASHGYSHQLIYTQSRQEFFEDIIKTKNILENITGQAVEGYRAPGFSITKNTTWAIDELVKAGYKHDSSIFPATRGHGGISDANLFPHEIETQYGTLKEFPISVVNLFSKRICFFGGGYLRLFPYPIIRHMTKRVNDEERPVVYYIHPREIDPYHPRLHMNWKRNFKSYVNLKSTLPKLKNLLYEQSLTSFQNWLKEYGDEQKPFSVAA